MSESEKGITPLSTGVFARPVGFVFDFYLNGEIETPDNYVEWNHIIRSAADGDTIQLHINSYGGDIMTAIQLMRSLSETRAHVVASVEGACMSAATCIFLVADSFEISDHSMFMFHNYSGFTAGKGHEMVEQIVHEEKWSKNLLSKIYDKFLTEVEIEAIAGGRDIWMTPEEVGERLTKRMTPEEEVPEKKKRQKKVQQPVKP